MARTHIPVQALPAFGGGIQGVTKTAGDAANGQQFINDGNSRLHVQNLARSAKTVTVVSVPDAYGRTKDTVLTVPAASGGDPGSAVAGPFAADLFGQAGSKV